MLPPSPGKSSATLDSTKAFFAVKHRHQHLQGRKVRRRVVNAVAQLCHRGPLQRYPTVPPSNGRMLRLLEASSGIVNVRNMGYRSVCDSGPPHQLQASILNRWQTGVADSVGSSPIRCRLNKREQNREQRSAVEARPECSYEQGYGSQRDEDGPQCASTVAFECWKIWSDAIS